MRVLTKIGVIVLSLSAHSLYAQNYRIQVATYNEAAQLDYFEQAGVTNAIVQEIDQNTLYKYYVGEAFLSYSKAMEVQQDIVSKGFKNARVIDVEKLAEACAKSPCGAGKLEPETVTSSSALNTEEYDFSAIKGHQLVSTIFFNFDKDDLTNNSIEELELLYDMLIKNPSIHVELASHTDAKGSDNYNMNLAKRRSESAKKYLLNKGIDINRIETTVKGESSPIAKNETSLGKDLPEGRKLNRRVEFIVRNPSGLAMENLMEEIEVPAHLRVD